MRIAPLLPLAFTLSACNDKADPAADTDISAADVHPNSGAYARSGLRFQP